MAGGVDVKVGFVGVVGFGDQDVHGLRGVFGGALNEAGLKRDVRDELGFSLRRAAGFQLGGFIVVGRGLVVRAVLLHGSCGNNRGAFSRRFCGLSRFNVLRADLVADIFELLIPLKFGQRGAQNGLIPFPFFSRLDAFDGESPGLRKLRDPLSPQRLFIRREGVEAANLTRLTIVL